MPTVSARTTVATGRRERTARGGRDAGRGAPRAAAPSADGSPPPRRDASTARTREHEEAASSTANTSERDDELHHARHRQQVHHDPEVDARPRDTRAPRSSSSAVAGPRRPAAEHDGQQVAERAEQHLRGEADRERADEPAEAGRGIRPARCERRRPRREGDRAERRTSTIAAAMLQLAKVHRRRAAGPAARPRHDEADADEVDEDADARRAGADRAGSRRADDDEPADAAARALGGRSRSAPSDDPGVQHGRPQQDDRADDGEPDPAEQVEGEMGGVEPVVQAAGQVGARHSDAERAPR